MKFNNLIVNEDSNDMVDRLTSAEMGKLWAVYTGNTMSKCVLTYFLNHVNDSEIKTIVQDALNLTEFFLYEIKKIFENEKIPIPLGLTDDDVNKGAPRLFMDEFYLHYLKYAGKAGLSIYVAALPLMIRPDVREFLNYSIQETAKMLIKVNETLLEKGVLHKPPFIPIPNKVEFVGKQSYLNGFFGEVRSLHALEIAHLHDIIENDVTSKALLIGFVKVAKSERVRQFFQRGKDLTMRHIEKSSHHLQKEDLPSPPLLDDLVEPANISPFSDKLMVFHKIDMFSMKIRSYGNALSLNGRRDLAAMYGKFLLDVGLYIEDGANITIDEHWMEKPPHAVDRDISFS